MSYNLKSTGINTGNVTLDINSLGVKEVVIIDEAGGLQQLLPNTLLYGTVLYNGTYFILLTNDHRWTYARRLLTNTGDTLYASGAYAPAKLAIGTAGYVMTSRGGVPAWENPPMFKTAVGDTVKLTMNTERNSNNTVGYGTEVKRFTLRTAGRFRFTVSRRITNQSYTGSFYLRQVQNGVTVNLIEISPIVNDTYITSTVDSVMDHLPDVPIMVYIKSSNAGSTTYIKDCTVKFVYTELVDVVNTD
jgi:hypothetical protein